jgi:hypothetical protein
MNRELHCSQFILLAKSVSYGAVQVSLMDVSDSNPLIWSIPMSESDAVEIVEAFEKYGYSKKFKELTGEF